MSSGSGSVPSVAAGRKEAMPPASLLARALSPPSAVTLRAVLLGIAGVIVICGLTPYNDYALNNTFLVGNNLPLAVVMFMFLFTLMVNGPLNRWKPSWAFSAGEITVA